MLLRVPGAAWVGGSLRLCDSHAWFGCLFGCLLRALRLCDPRAWFGWVFCVPGLAG